MKPLISLLAAATAVIMLSLPGFAQSSYTWALACKGAAAPPSLGVGTGVNWVWLHDGVQISQTIYGSASCATPPLSGSAEIPTSINGIQVNGIAVSLSLGESPAGCQAYASVTKSFDPSDPKFSISASVSAPAKNGSFYGDTPCPKASFSFSLKG